MGKNTVRIAEAADAEELLEIYAPYVRDTAISFEYEVPSPEEFRQRIVRTLEKYPYLAAERDGELVGYACAGAFKQRAAYNRCVETTIYVRGDMKRKGVGRALYGALETALSLQNILNLNACIGYPETEDEYLTRNSVQFHEHLGFRMVGKFHNCGYKFNRWYHMVWMEKLLGEHASPAFEVKRFEEIQEEFRKSLDMYL